MSSAERRRRFEAIAEEVFDPLQRYLRRRLDPSDAEDVFSEVLLTVWRRIDDAPPGPALPWCYGVARRLVANRRRALRRQVRLMERLIAQPQRRFEPDPSDAGPDPELAAALDRLSEGDREVLRLWAWEQLEPREIAPILGISVNAAALRLSRSREKLGRELSRQNPRRGGHEALEGTQENR